MKFNQSGSKKPTTQKADPAMDRPLEPSAVGEPASFSEEDFLEAMTEAVPVGVVFADATGRITKGNRRVEEMVRHPVIFSDGVDSYGDWIAFHEDGRQVESYEYPLSRVIRDKEEHSSLDVHYQRGDGTMFWMRIISEPVHDAAGNLLGATVALIDIDREYRLQQSQALLIAELNHRVKNAFSVTMAIVTRSLKNSEVSSEMMGAIAARLGAYSSVHSRLIGTDWGYATLKQVASDVLAPIGGDAIVIEGPSIEMSSQMGISLSMAFYELVTNASKYGALSVPEGTISLRWSIDSTQDHEQVRIVWAEKHGPPAAAPTSKGFGSFITQRAVCAETKGSVDVSYRDTGFEWVLTMPKPEERQQNK